MKLEGRNIVITGGTTGIGRELVRRLQAGNRIMVVASNRQRLALLAAECPEVITHCADLANGTAVASAADEARKRLGTVHVLINNAAVQYEPHLAGTGFRLEAIRHEIDVNFTAVCVLTAKLLPALRESGNAAIVNVNSGLALAPKTGSAVYCATKAAMNVFSQSLRYQLEGSGVSVLQAFLPLVDTNMTAGRGSGKISPAEAADAIVRGIEREIQDHDIGRIRLLRRLLRLAPGTARRIMKAA